MCRQRVVADVARQAHPVRARAVGRGAAQEGRRLADAQVERGRMVDPVHARAGAAPAGGRRTQSCSSGSSSRPGTAGGGSASSGSSGLSWNEPIAIRSGRSPCVTVHAARGDRTPVAHPVDGQLERPGRRRRPRRSTRAGSGEPCPSTVALAASRACATVCPPKTRSKRPGSATTRKRSSPARLRARARGAGRRATTRIACVEGRDWVTGGHG